MYSQPYSLVGETLDNRLLDSYRVGVSDAEELSVNSANQLLSIFTDYHFNPQTVTENFTLLTETANQLSDVYRKLYKYSYANNQKVCVQRESVSEHMTWATHAEYLAEVYDRIFAIVENSHQYDIDHSTLLTRLERLARNLFVYVNITRTSFLTKFTIKTEETPSFIFVELPGELHSSMYPLWYLANSLGVLPSLEKSVQAEYEPPEELPDAFFSLTQPETELLTDGADHYNRFTNMASMSHKPNNQTPTELFATLPPKEERPHGYAELLVSAYQEELQQEPQKVIAD